VIAPALLAFSISALGAWLLIRLAPRLRLIDRPNERSSHQAPTPRGGGIAMIIAVLVGLLLLPGGLPLAISPALLAALPVAALGLLDDRFGLRASTRLAGHLVAAVACILAFGVPSSFAGPAYLTLPVAVLAIAWGTNLFNFMDGIDGIAATEALFIAAVAAAMLVPSAMPVAAALAVIAAASAGFLIWNWAPARIFMGDVGSGFFGFFLAAIGVLTTRQGLIPAPVWLILWSTFIADTGVTLLRRIARGERWWSAHRSHAYQRLSRRVGSHATATLVYLAINIIVVLPCALLAHARPATGWWLCLGLLGCLSVLAYRAGAGIRD
jgi:Fuc2NAc and GlcNAc transferase